MNLKKNVLMLTLAAAALAAGCRKEGTTPEGDFDRAIGATTPDARRTPCDSANIPNVISSNLTLDSGRVWKLNGPTYVTNGAILTIQPGTFIKGVKKVNTANNYPSFLLVTSGSTLIANGTAAQPIVFTSENSANTRRKGDWGGIVLLGSAHTNCGIQQIEGIQSAYVTSRGLPYPATIQYGQAAGAAPNYGGTSGSLQNVRIEFAGDVIAEGNELNGLTLGGVGSQTMLRYIQVSYGADDAFEFFGGAANAKYLVSYRNDDDDFDFDQGYQGAIQHAISVKDPIFGYSSSPNGIESNNVTAPVVATDTFRTRPVLTNFTILGTNTATGVPAGGIGALFRVNSSYIFVNSLVGGFNTGGSFTGAGIWARDAVHAFVTPGFGNPTSTASTTNSFLSLVNPYAANPDFRYIAPSPATGPASFVGVPIPHPGGAVTAWDAVTHWGAFPSNTGARWDAQFGSYSALTNLYTRRATCP